MSTNQHLRRAEQRAARVLSAEKNIGYAQAVEELRNSADTLARCAAASQTELSSKIEPTEQDYRNQLGQLCEYAEAWDQSMNDDDDEPDNACERKMIAQASLVLTGLRNDGYKRRVKQDMVEVCRSELRTFAQHLDSYEELVFAYEMSPAHSRYETGEELTSALRSAQRFLARADDPEFRAHFTHEVNPLYQAER